jgi:diguanylate cyclase (GGDEF)-like protein
MTIRKSLLTGLAVLAILGALQGAASIIGSQIQQRGMADRARSMVAVNFADQALMAFERAASAARVARRAAEPEQAEREAARFHAETVLLHHALSEAARREPRLAKLSVDAEEWVRLVEARLPGHQAGGQTALLREDLLADRHVALQQAIAKAVSDVLYDAVVARERAGRSATGVQAAILGVVLLSLGAAVWLGLLLRRRVLRPLRLLTGATRRLVAGELRFQVAGTGRRDEIGAIAKALEGLRQGTLEARRLEAVAAADRSVAEAHATYLAHHDALTGLANRALLRERLDHAIALARRNNERVGVYFLDLDRFKGVNDSRGHAAGDALLREVARRLLAVVRDTDTVARLGGDEFVVVQLAIENPQGAEQLAGRISDTLSDIFDLGDGEQARVTASVGIALFPEDGESIDTLLAHADTALYRVKVEGRNGFAFFRPDMDREAHLRRSLEQDLQLALQRGQLSLAFQPQAAMESGVIVGFEALLRWNHPARGPVRPDHFIPIAEASGAIIPIGAWVLREACSEAMRWTVPLRIAVNVSPAQLLQGDFATLVAETLAATGLPPARLELEVTEGLFINDPARTLAALQRIRASGVSVSMDDFGTGYSSLSSLRAFPFDRIKIDRCFVKDLTTSNDAAAIVHAVLGLARGLGMPVVAEGIEDAEQMAALRAARCAEGQGYLIGKPGPIAAFADVTNPQADRRELTSVAAE